MKRILRSDRWIVIRTEKHLVLTPKSEKHELYGIETYIPVSLFPDAQIGSTIDRLRYIDDDDYIKSKWQPTGFATVGSWIDRVRYINEFGKEKK